MYGQPKIVIVKKKKVVAGGHHGGSWKVAYADFVTAMMAFFLVMWIMGMDQGVKDMVQGYFSNPIGFRKAYGGGANPLSTGMALASLDVQRTLMLARQAQSDRFRETAERLQQEIQEAGLVVGIEAEVEIVVTDQGLRIDIMETGNEDAFFDEASAALKPALDRVLATLASELSRLSNPIIVEGHTDALPFRGRSGYSNWELSVDRANAARRSLIGAGLPAERIVEVRGYADRRPKIAEAPLDARNRRISMLLPFTSDESGLTMSDVARALSRAGLEGLAEPVGEESDPAPSSPTAPPAGPGFIPEEPLRTGPGGPEGLR